MEKDKSHGQPRSSNGHQNSSSEASIRDRSQYLLPSAGEKIQVLDIPELSALRTPILQFSSSEDSSLNDTIASRTQPISDNVDDIFSPRALPAEQAEPADPSKPWNFLSEHKLDDLENDHKKILQPKQSIADRLGSMVDCGWVGMDVFGKSYSDRKTSDPISSSFHIPYAEVKRQSYSEGDKGLPESSFCAYQNHESQTIQQMIYRSEGEKTQPTEEDTSRKKEQRQLRASTTTKHALQRSSSHAALQNSDSYISRPADGQNERSRRSDRLKRSKSNGTEIGIIASSHARGRADSDLGRRAAATVSAITTDSALSTPSSRRSSIQRSGRSVSGKTRWRMRWPKLVPVDLQTPASGYSNVDPVNSASPKNRKNIQQGPIPPNHLPREGIIKYSILHCSPGDGPDETQDSLDDRREDNTDGLVSQYRSSVTQLRSMNQSQVTDRSRNTTENSSSALLQHWRLSDPWWEQPEEESSPKTVKQSPTHLFSPDIGSLEKPAKSTSESTSMYGTFDTAPGGGFERSSQQKSSTVVRDSSSTSESPTHLISHSLETTKGSPTPSLSPTCTISDNVCMEGRPELISSSSATVNIQARSSAEAPPSQGLEAAEQFVEHSRASAGGSIASVPSNGVPDSVSREVKSSGKGIKRIQVTVTFDGAADIVIDTRLDPIEYREEEDVAWID